MGSVPLRVPRVIYAGRILLCVSRRRILKGSLYASKQGCGNTSSPYAQIPACGVLYQIFPAQRLISQLIPTTKKNRA